jgi:hypothetical protein
MLSASMGVVELSVHITRCTTTAMEPTLRRASETVDLGSLDENRNNFRSSIAEFRL